MYERVGSESHATGAATVFQSRCVTDGHWDKLPNNVTSKVLSITLSLFASKVHVICSGLRFKIDRELHSLATAAFIAHSDELEGCPTGSPGSSMPKSARKSSSSDTYFAFNFVPNIVCEFPMVIPFELAVWMTADATRLPVGREDLVFNRKWVLGGWG